MEIKYWVGDFFIDLSRNQITQHKQSQNPRSQTVAPKALAVLTYLAENQGRVVSHDELLDKVWQNTVVTPNTLQRSIAQLRKALGDDGKDQIYIKTHAKQGYSLECDVRWSDNTEASRPNSLLQGYAADEPHINNEGTRDTLADNTLSDKTFSDKTSSDKTSSDEKNTHKPESSRPSVKWFAAMAGILVLGIVGYQFPVSDSARDATQTSPLTFDLLRSLTATDDKEFDATYSPDGQYIIFHRYLDQQCGNKLWAKNINTQEEIQLTQDWGAYGSHSFSEDGKSLVFIETYACSEPTEQKDCYDLVSVDFEKALQNPQRPSVMLQCKNSTIRKPVWLGNDNIALMQTTTNRRKLIDYSVARNESAELYELEDGNLVDFTYSGDDDLIAVTSIHNDGEHYIDMLKSDGRLLSSHPIERPREIAKFLPIYPVFRPSNDQLIFSTGRRLFTLSYDGKVEKINLPFDERMVPTEFHPNGNRLLLIKGRYDSDIVRLSFNQIAETNSHTQIRESQVRQPQTIRSPFNQLEVSQLAVNQFEGMQFQTIPTLSRPAQLMQPESFSIFERSTVEDGLAMFQPGGELIAFISERSGDQQLWISDGSGPQPLSHFPMDSTIHGFDWAADGNSLLISANRVLAQVFLDSSQRSFPQKKIELEYPVAHLFQWDSDNNTALALVRKQGILKLAEVDLNNSEFKVVSDKLITWALKSEDGRLIYKDYMGRFWQPGPAEPQHIDSLDNHGDKTKSFIMQGNVIYAINSQNQLWSYDLDTGSFDVLGEISDDVVSLTDINQEEMLMTVLVAEKKEVVELSLRSE